MNPTHPTAPTTHTASAHCDAAVWSEALRRLEDSIPDFAFAAWITPLKAKVSADRVVIGCPSSFHRDRVRIQYLAQLETHLRDALGSSSSSNKAVAIELVTMVEFATRPGHSLSDSVMRRVASQSRTVARDSAEAQVEAPLQACAGSGSSVAVLSGGTPVTASSVSSASPLADSAMSAVGAPIVTSEAESRSVSPVVSSGSSISSEAWDSTEQSSSTSPSPALMAVPRSAPQKRRTTRPEQPSQENSRPSPQPRARRKPEADPAQAELPFTFESFVVGPCNALAREAALALARERQQSLNLLYLGGGPGMGKTHLARATAMEAQRHASAQAPLSSHTHTQFHSDHARVRASQPQSGARPGQRGVVYTTAERFTTEFVSAMRGGRSEDFMRRYRGRIGMLVVEDIQFFSGRTKTQLELFHTIGHVLDAGGRVLLTGDRSPRELTGLDQRVRTQVARGFVAELEPPDAMVRRHLLRTKASAGGIHLPADCLDLLVDSTAGSVRDVESMLIQVVTTASLLGRKVDFALTQEAVALKTDASTVLTRKTVEVSEVVRIVAAFFGKRPEALASRSRRRDVLVPRQLAMYLAHRYCEASFAEIGRGLGRGHPSVRNAVERIERQVLENAPVRYQVEALSERIDQTLKNRG